MAKTEPKFQCEDTVSFQYFSALSFCTIREIMLKLITIQKLYPNKRLYVGQSVNPCGRFRNNYNTAVYPPLLSHIMARVYEVDQQLIKESVAHNVDYEKMFVLCRMENIEDIKQMEIDAIAYLHNLVDNPVLVGNKSDGGEGPDGKASAYFIYVCISKKDYEEADFLTSESA